MSTFTSKPTTVNLSPEELDAKFADFSVMEEKLKDLTDEQREKLGNVQFTNDSIVINTPQVGAITLRAVERKPGLVRMQAEQSPVPMGINISYVPAGEGKSDVTGEMDVDIPAMLKPLIGPTMQKAVDQFGSLFASLA